MIITWKLMIKLDQYQLDAIRKLRTGSILCGGVGSGKSRTALAYYYIKQGGVLDPMLPMPFETAKDLYIITTARKRDTLEWEEETLPFGLNKVDDENRNYICNYYVDSWNNIKKYRDVKGAFFIFDEQRVVSNGTWSRSFLHIAKNNDWILLSATPGDTWSDYIPVFIANGFYKNKTEFTQEHVVYKPFSPYPIVDRYVNTRKLEYFKEKILVDMDYHSPATEIPVDVPVKYNRELYMSVVMKRWDPFNDCPIQNASEYCLLLRKIINSDPSRLEAVIELCNRHDKIIIFYNFDFELDLLKETLTKNSIPYSEWNGHKHEPILNTDKWVYLIQYTAGSEGWNCIETNVIIFYSQTYSYKQMVQAAGRINRRNTPFKNLYLYTFRSKAGIDLAIHHALKNKKDFNARRFAS